jgi:hypothetical protein
MKTVTPSQYSAMVEAATVLDAADDEPPAVLRTADDRIVKIFRRSRGPLADRLWPYAARFASNARRLARRGVVTVAVEGVFRCPGLGMDFVVYPMLPGDSLRDLAADPPRLRDALSGLPGYIARLQRRGVHFRGLHLGNVLYQGPDRYALLDVGYLRLLQWPLDVRSRASNFRNIMRYDRDLDLLVNFGLEEFMARYLEAARLGDRRRRALCRTLASAARDPSVADVFIQLSR